ncbi:MAG: type II toxin-antitoxin system HicB family antitoxin [Lachnospiraceae bacterium]|nr:type II toxin-antitoxin system HicB family antitoxin [Lachnospiraceae bacterium]
MKRVYPVIFTQTDDDKDTVLVEVPDFEIYTEGFGMADAIEMARDAIGLAGITFEDMGKEVPQPRDRRVINLSETEFAQDGKQFISLVDIDFAEYRRKVDNRSVRRNVTLPNWLNREAEKAHINVSRVLQEALMQKMNL